MVLLKVSQKNYERNTIEIRMTKIEPWKFKDFLRLAIKANGANWKCTWQKCNPMKIAVLVVK